MSANSDCNVDDLFLALGWRKLKHQRQVSTATMMYKTVHGMTPDCLTSKFVSRDEITSYRAFSLTWPASMLIYWNKRKHSHEKRV